MRSESSAVAESFVNAYVDGEFGDRVVLLWRAIDGTLERKTIPAEYVSYHKLPQIPNELQRDIEGSRFVKSARVEGEWYRVGWRDRQVRDDMCLGVGPERLSPLRNAGVEHFEADVHPVRRHLTDTNAGIQKPKRCYLDFEGDSRVPFPRKEDARVLAWAVTDDDGHRFQGVLERDSDDSERSLLEQLWEVLRPYDQVLAWNGDNYDFPVLKARTRRCGVRADIRRLLYLDQLDLFRTMNMHAAESGEEKTSLALNAVAKSLLGRGKKDFDARFTWEAWLNATPCEGARENDDSRRCGKCRKCMSDYNLEDAALLPEIERETGYADVLLAICEVCHIFPDSRALNNTHQMDGFMLRFGLEKNVHFPTKKFTVVTEKYKGAWVVPPKEKAGIHHDVHVFDFASLYPSILLTYNMSPETKVATVPADQPLPPGICRAPYTGICFATGTKGLLAEALDVLLRLRAPWKKLKASLPPGSPEWHDANRKDNAYKVAANALYGVCGSPFSRFFDREIAESCTQAGRFLLEQTLEAARARGWNPIYGDTDSGFVGNVDRIAFVAFVDWCNKELYPKLIAEHGCTENRIKLENEKGFSAIVFVTAKRYCNPPEAPIWMGDLSFKPLGDVRVGDEIVGWIEGKRGSNVQRRLLSKTKVVAVHKHIAPIVKLTMRSGRQIRCTADHKWLAAYRSLGSTSQFMQPKVGRKICHVIDSPRVLNEEERVEASWLGGIFDGEGSLASHPCGQIVISQSLRVNPEVCAHIESVLDVLGLPFSNWAEGEDGCRKYAIRGGKQSRLNFMTWCKPAKSPRNAPMIFQSRFAEVDEIVVIEEDGVGEVIGLTTETGNYIAWGYASKNCGFYSYYKGTAADPADPKACEIKGLEYKRGDAAQHARRLQERVIRMIRTETSAEAYRAEVRKLLDHILKDQLDVDEVAISQAITKELEEYAGVKKEGGAIPPHVRVGLVLKQRGYQVTAGTRIKYVVADSESEDGMIAIPAEDYAGELDRFYLWENRIYPPTMRLLEAAFPNQDWKAGLESVRPPRRKTGKPAHPNQLGFLMVANSGPITPLNLSMDADILEPKTIEAIKEVVSRYPGPRPLVFTLRLETGALVTLDAKMRVSGAPAMLAEVDALLLETASRHLLLD
jgi:DNA polymerase elongation subunit (family B)